MSNEEILKGLEGLNGMSDAEFNEFMQKVSGGEAPAEKKEVLPQPNLRMKLADGTEIEARTPEELASLAQAHQPQRQEEPKPAERPAFDAKKWVSELERDPIAAQSYLDQARYGYDPAQVMNLMAQTLGAMTKEVEELRKERLNGVVADPAHRQIVEGIVKELGMPDTVASRKAAMELAQARNLIHPAERQQARQQSQEFQAPRFSAAPNQNELPPIENTALDNASDEQLERLMAQAYGLKNRMFS